MSALDAFDRAAQQLLDAEQVAHLPGQIAKLRVLFMDELAALDDQPPLEPDP